MLRGKGGALALAAAACLTLGGCYGSFNLTRNLHHWVGTFPDDKEWSDPTKTTGAKWGTEAVFLVTSIFWVYGVCTFVDAIILNSIEFWTGDNPMDPPAAAAGKTSSTRTFENGDQVVVLERMGDETAGSILVKVYKKGELKASFVAEGGAGKESTLRDASGNVVATARTLENGELALFGVNGKRISAP